MQKKIKRRFGDKKDGRLIRGKELDTNHFIMPLVWPRRTENEAFVSERLDLTEVNEYLKEKNANRGSNRLSLFMIYVAALGKVFLNRPKMNRFYRGGRLYERYKVSVGFVVKKTMTDDGDEGLARVEIDPCDTLFTLAEKIRAEIENCRKDALDKTSDDIRILMKFPLFIGKLFMAFIKFIDRHFVVPKSISASDLFFNSIVISHLGSIKMHAGYHHLSNWGTNSFFTTLGSKKIRPFYDKFGNLTMRDSIDVGMTIDERIADGYYFSKSIKMLKELFANPKLLETPFLDNSPDKE